MLKYKKASAEDLPQLKQLGITSYSEFSSVLTSDNWAKLNTALHNEQKLEQLIQMSQVLICKSGKQIVGMIYFVPRGNPTELYQENWSYIRFLGVDPAYRGQGIGKALTQMCIDLALEQQEEWIALHTSEFMDAARHIYESMGFERTKVFELFGKKYWIYLKGLNLVR